MVSKAFYISIKIPSANSLLLIDLEILFASCKAMAVECFFTKSKLIFIKDIFIVQMIKNLLVNQFL